MSGDHNVLAERGGIAVGQVHVEHHHHHAAEPVRVPRQLPLPGKDFVGREANLQDLDTKLLSPGASWPLLLTGSPGWARRRWRCTGRTCGRIGFLTASCTPACRDSPPRRFEGIVLSNVAMSYVYIGRFDQAYGLFEDSLAAAREVGDRHAEAWALTNLGAAQRRNGVLDDSLSALRRAAEIRTAIDDLDGEAWTRAELGRTCSDLELSDAAEAAFERSIALHLAHGNTYGRARALDQLGQHLLRTGQYARAREVWEEALPLFTALRGSDAARLRLTLASLRDFQ